MLKNGRQILYDSAFTEVAFSGFSISGKSIRLVAWPPGRQDAPDAVDCKLFRASAFTTGSGCIIGLAALAGLGVA
jgi:hypothetical protein